MSIIRVHRAYGAAISGVPKGAALWRLEAYAVTDTKPSVTVHRAYGAAVSGVPKGAALWRLEAYTVTQLIPFVTVHRAYGAAVSGVPKGAALWRLEAYAVTAPDLTVLTLKNTAYVVLLLGERIRGRKHTLYTALSRVPVPQALKYTLYSAIKPKPPIYGFKTSHYTIIQGPRVKLYKQRAYVAILKVVIKARKVSAYSALTLRPPNIELFQLALYACLKRRPPVSAQKITIYTALNAPPPRARVRQAKLYSAIKRNPPAISRKHTLYSALKARPPVRGFAVTHYSVLRAPPVAVLLRKLRAYAIMQGGAATMWKGSFYALLFPVTNGPLRSEKITKYTVCQFIEPPNGYRIINVG